MSTLILEDLNLVTLNELLQRLPSATKVGELTAVIGERELFLPEQANRIVAHFSVTEESAPREFSVLREIADLIQLIKTQGKEELSSFEIKLKGILPKHLNQNHCIMVEVLEGNVLLSGYNPTIGRSFWPDISEILIAAQEEGKLHHIREQIVLHFSKL